MFGEDVARLRTDAGISLRALAKAAAIDASYLGDLERGRCDPSLATAAAIAMALGGDVNFRLYPTTGPRIRDAIQAAIVEALLRAAAPSWDRAVEVAVRRPSRGFIDVVFAQPDVVVATEVHSEIRRLEQLIRWSLDKAASLPSSDGWAHWSRGGAARVDRLLVLRSTRRNREIVRAHRETLLAAYPADGTVARRALAGEVAWPGSAVVWATVERGVARLLERQPPGMG